MKTLLRFFFRLLYHEFAFTYDLVAATVSFNRWKDWVMSVLPFLSGRRILEIGHGPGHLQRALLSRGLVAVGIDESAQMGRLARRNLKRAGSLASGSASSVAPATHPLASFAYAQTSLTRGVAQHLPFPNEMFDSVVATFPAEYIFEAETLAETQRVLAPGGRFIIVPGAIIIGRGALDRLLAWVFRITGEAPRDLPEILRERPKEPFAKAGFQLEVHEVAVRSSVVFIMVATKIEVMEHLDYAEKTTGTRQ